MTETKSIITMVFYIPIVIASLTAATIATDCGAENATIPIFVLLGDRLKVACPPNYCSGEYVIDHRNHNTSQYETIHQGMRKTNVTVRTLSDAGYFRCSKKCSDSRSASDYCYFELVVRPTILKWNISVINDSYSISCSATGYPTPFVHAEVQPHLNCSHNYQYHFIKVDNYTGKAVITIARSRVSMECLNIFCQSGNISSIQPLNLTNIEDYINNTSPLPSPSSAMPTTPPTNPVNATISTKYRKHNQSDKR